jgi:chemotaxis protein MotB
MESAKGTFFQLGSPEPTPALKDLLKVLSEEIGKLPNKISIEGHTDSKPYSGARSYDNWDLSTERANEARRLMMAEGIRPDQVSQVRGFADQKLRLPDQPEDPSNRRISLIVQYVIKDSAEVAPPDALTRLGMGGDAANPPSAPGAPGSAGGSTPAATGAGTTVASK